VRVIGDPEWAANPAYATRAGRHAHRREIDAQLDRWTRTRERDALVAELTRAGVPAAVVQDARDVVLDAHFWRRGALELADLSTVSEEIGVAPHLSAPWRMARADPRLLQPPPAALGSDNDYVFRELLGLSADELEALEACGVAARFAMPVERDPTPQLPPDEQLRKGLINGYDPDFRERIERVTTAVQHER
jgi:benzylsuccinate CoA-transferase BbsF subunit